ncbi:Alcohol dehydrogenase superfamily zinc-containing [Lasiodiplodia theobromae]|uniref:Alcohol dehydrogenase superfamily zinc-containing n=1 Tax=Lasiodiplodia theobromae TaxID=45133 RepID=A0A8H7IMZ2_9PEZI|nr:Alcohol dehydrogenase superfamily zinc-containing [Lasiodiplodia theobromae]
MDATSGAAKPLIDFHLRCGLVSLFNQPYELQDIPVPEIGDNDLLVKIGAAGFCHTDYQVFEGVYKSPLPMTPSHEPVGTIVAVGKEAAQKWQVGQRVGALLFKHACGTCAPCRMFKDPPGSDKPDIVVCQGKELLGLTHDGGFAEYVVADAETTSLLPDGLPFEQAAPLMCAGATVWGGIKHLGLPPGAPVAVIGVGGLGQLAIQFLKALGYRTVAIDNRPEGLALAEEIKSTSLRADAVVDYNSEDALEQVVEFAGDGGVAGVVVCTDDVPATEWSVKILRPRGVCVPLGLPTAGFHFNAFDVVFKELKIQGSLVASKKLVDEMLEVVAKHRVWSHITTVNFEDVPRLPEMYMDKHLKGRLVLKM